MLFAVESMVVDACGVDEFGQSVHLGVDVDGGACDECIEQVLFHERAHGGVQRLVLNELSCEIVFEHCGHTVFSHVNAEWVSFDDDAFAVHVQRVLVELHGDVEFEFGDCLLYTSPSPRDRG